MGRSRGGSFTSIVSATASQTSDATPWSTMVCWSLTENRSASFAATTANLPEKSSSRSGAAQGFLRSLLTVARRRRFYVRNEAKQSFSRKGAKTQGNNASLCAFAREILSLLLCSECFFCHRCRHVVTLP